MLVNLHVKNLALIEEEEIEFGKGLNILSGETGAGKSIILGALNLALGEKVPKEMLRDESRDGLVEVVFTITDESQREALRSMDIEFDDEVILSRKITETRSVAKINGEMIPADKLRKIGGMFIDIYGQHEHQSLLDKRKHLQMLDEYGKAEIEPLKENVKKLYQEFKEISNEYEEAISNDKNRDSEIEFLKHEIEEIENANIKLGEDEQLEEDYRRMNNSSRIVAACNEAYNNTGGNGTASDEVARAIRSLRSVEEYDEQISDIVNMLDDVDSILADFNRELSSYMSDMQFDESTFKSIEDRLDTLNSLKQKYGPTIEDVEKSLTTKIEQLEKYEKFDEYLKELKDKLDTSKGVLLNAATELSECRKRYAYDLLPKVRTALLDLNFLDVEFDMYFTKLENVTLNGFDEAEFIISTNPGEPMKPLKNIASGGEMSRIMLAIKTVLAEQDNIDTMIFDEIDAGISGRTAQALSEKLCFVAKNKQVICITHLPQIAAMADKHFLIEKGVVGNKTISTINGIDSDKRVEELSRMLGGSTITDAVLANATELIDKAKEFKAKIL